MSSRRKSSNPCMVRVLNKLPKEQEDPEEVMDVELSADDDAAEKEQSNSPESEETQQESSDNPDQQSGPKTEETQKPTEQKESEDGDRPPIIENTEKDRDAAESDPTKKQNRGYECKYCPFLTQNLNDFKEHVDSSHPNVILNPLYLCAVCNFNTKKFDTLTEHNERCHPGESNFKFKRIKMNNQTILEQTIEGCSSNAIIYNSSSKGEELGAPPLVKPATVKIAKPKILSSDSKRTEGHGGKLPPELSKKPITALNVNGTVIIPESTLLKADSLSHIMPSLQRPLNYTQVGPMTSKYMLFISVYLTFTGTGSTNGTTARTKPLILLLQVDLRLLQLLVQIIGTLPSMELYNNPSTLTVLN